MQCYVYKGRDREEHYLYLPEEFDVENPSEKIPDALLSMLGELSLVVHFELTADRKLPNADPKQILQDIEQNGFYFQMPKDDMYADEERLFC